MRYTYLPCLLPQRGSSILFAAKKNQKPPAGAALVNANVSHPGEVCLRKRQQTFHYFFKGYVCQRCLSSDAGASFARVHQTTSPGGDRVYVLTGRGRGARFGLFPIPSPVIAKDEAISFGTPSCAVLSCAGLKTGPVFRARGHSRVRARFSYLLHSYAGLAAGQPLPSFFAACRMLLFASDVQKRAYARFCTSLWFCCGVLGFGTCCVCVSEPLPLAIPVQLLVEQYPFAKT